MINFLCHWVGHESPEHGVVVQTITAREAAKTYAGILFRHDHLDPVDEHIIEVWAHGLKREASQLKVTIEMVPKFTATKINKSGHVWAACTTEMGEDCDCGGYLCRGGLRVCTVCKGAESSLATECPGRPLTENEDGLIMLGEIDFKGGKWVHTGAP